MLLLYYGIGPKEVQLVRQKNSTVWGLVKSHAVRYLQMDGSPETADILQNTPFELWDGTNGFGDEFELLYFKPSLETFLQLRLDADTVASRQHFRRIADALKEMNNPIRFIAVDVNTDDMDGVPTPELQITSAVVERALIDFETLSRSASGAVRADPIPASSRQVRRVRIAAVALLQSRIDQSLRHRTIPVLHRSLLR